MYLCIYAATRLFCIWYLPVLLLFSLSRNPPSCLLVLCFLFSVLCSPAASLFCLRFSFVCPIVVSCLLLLLLKWSSHRGWSYSWRSLRTSKLWSQAGFPGARPLLPSLLLLLEQLYLVATIRYPKCGLLFRATPTKQQRQLWRTGPRTGLRKLLSRYLFIWCGHRLIHLPPGGTAGLAISGDIGQWLPTHYLSSGRPLNRLDLGTIWPRIRLEVTVTLTGSGTDTGTGTGTSWGTRTGSGMALRWRCRAYCPPNKLLLRRSESDGISSSCWLPAAQRSSFLVLLCLCLCRCLGKRLSCAAAPAPDKRHGQL